MCYYIINKIYVPQHWTLCMVYVYSISMMVHFYQRIRFVLVQNMFCFILFIKGFTICHYK